MICRPHLTLLVNPEHPALKAWPLNYPRGIGEALYPNYQSPKIWRWIRGATTWQHHTLSIKPQRPALEGWPRYYPVVDQINNIARVQQRGSTMPFPSNYEHPALGDWPTEIPLGHSDAPIELGAPHPIYQSPTLQHWTQGAIAWQYRAPFIKSWISSVGWLATELPLDHSVAPFEIFGIKHNPSSVESRVQQRGGTIPLPSNYKGQRWEVGHSIAPFCDSDATSCDKFASSLSLGVVHSIS